MVLVVAFLPSINLSKSKERLDKESIRKILPYITAMFILMIIFYTLPSNFSIIITKKIGANFLYRSFNVCTKYIRVFSRYEAKYYYEQI